MSSLNKQLLSIIQDLNLGEITEIKKFSLLDEIGEAITGRIIVRLIKETPAKKRDLFIQKINEHKEDPDKILLFIDHFIENADKCIDEEIRLYKKDLQKVIKTKS